MSRNYYCLVAGLPNISFEDSKLSYGSADLLADLKDSIHEDDYKYFELFRLRTDNDNIFTILSGLERRFFDNGNYNLYQLEEMIEEPVKAVSYIREFIDEFDKTNEDIDTYRKKLTASYCEYVLSCDNLFLKNWFELEFNIRNIFAALNSRKHGLEIEKAVVDINDVSEALKKSTLRDFGLGGTLEYMEKLLTIFQISDLMAREKAVDLFKWDWLEDNTLFDYFTVEKLLSHYIKLSTIERWITLDPETGKELFNRLIRELEKEGKNTGIEAEKLKN
jgi:hypothetical protein